MKLVKKNVLLGALALLLGGAAARAEGPAAPRAAASAAAAAKADIAKTLGFVPQYMLTLPQDALPGAWEEIKGLELNPKTALDGKTKELVGLAVAAQVPCHYCIYAHTEFAKLAGATTAEIGEAISMAGIARHWSTVLNGVQTDETKFRAEVARVVENVKKMAAGKGPSSPPVKVVDGETALRDAAAALGGYAPEFLGKFPAAGRAGAWRRLKETELSPATSLSGKQKELVGLAVAAQVPCRYCVIAHTEYAKLNGATDAEISEALGMAALTRDMSTLLNGVQTDEAQFRRDVDRLVKGARAAARKERTTAAGR